MRTLKSPNFEKPHHPLLSLLQGLRDVGNRAKNERDVGNENEIERDLGYRKKKWDAGYEYLLI